MARFPARFAYIVRFDPNDPDIDDLMAQVGKAPGRICYPVSLPVSISKSCVRADTNGFWLPPASGAAVMIYPGGEHWR